MVNQIKESGGLALSLVADIAVELEVEAATARCAAELGAPLVLVNNAGIVRDNLLFRMPVSDWDAVMNVHLRGSFLMTRAVQRYMVEAYWGRVINMSSVSALGMRGQTNYAAAKAGLQGFTRTLAIEWASSASPRTASHPAISKPTCWCDRGPARHHLRGVRRTRGRRHSGRPNGQGRGHSSGGRVLRSGGLRIHHRADPLRVGWPGGLTGAPDEHARRTDRSLLPTASLQIAGFDRPARALSQTARQPFDTAAAAAAPSTLSASGFRPPRRMQSLPAVRAAEFSISSQETFAITTQSPASS